MTVSRVAVTTGAPGAATAFAPTLPTHVSGDRLILAVVGKIETTTIPTINQSWVLLGSGTGGTGSNAADTGQTFWALYGIDATSSSMTAPTVTPGGTAPNSWVWIAASHRPGSGGWQDSISTSAAWVTSASDTTTGSPLTGTAGAWTGVQPTVGDAIFAVGVIPTDLGSALGATTLTATGLSGGTVTSATSQYVENTLGNDSAAVWAGWTDFTGTASAGLAVSFTVTGATTQSGSIIAVALRENDPIPVTTTFDAENGTSGTTLTTGNMPGTLTSGTVGQFNTSAAAHGNLGYKWDLPSGGTGLIRYAIAASKVQRFRGSFRLRTSSTIHRRVMMFTQEGNVINLRLTILNSGLYFQGASGSTILGPIPISTNTWYDISIVMNTGSTTSNGSFTCNVYLKDGTTPIASGTVTGSAYNMSAVTAGIMEMGSNEAGASVCAFDWDTLRHESEQTTEFGPYVTAATIKRRIGKRVY